MVMSMLLQKRIKSRVSLLCRYSSEKFLVEHTVDCPIHFGCVLEATDLPVFNVVSSFILVYNYRAVINFGLQDFSRIH